MRSVAVYICNYNGKEVLKKCLNSVRNQKAEVEFDTYVIDNASTDNSIDMINQEFQDLVVCLRNDRNLGGTGGFNVGLKDAIEKEYQYVILLDNDAILASNAVQAFYDYMEIHKDCGIVGAKIYVADFPEVIQEFGSYINFDNFSLELGYAGKSDDQKLPLVCECDYVPACAMMVRGIALKKVGIFPDKNFIYWDDIEFGKKMNLAGYKVVAYKNAVAWHRGGGIKTNDTPFFRYYFFRNQWDFFSKYADDNEEHLAETIVNQAFTYIRGFSMKRMYDLERCTIYALNDFIYGISGRAAEYKINSYGECREYLSDVLQKSDKVYLQCNASDFETEEDIENILYCICSGLSYRCKNNQIKIIGNREMYECLVKAMAERGKLNIIYFGQCEGEEENKIVFRACSHIDKVYDRQIVPTKWIDKYCNCIMEIEDSLKWGNWEKWYEFFVKFYKPQIKQRIHENKS